MTETTAPAPLVEVFSAVAIEREISASLSKARRLTLAEIERRRDRFGIAEAAMHAARILHASVAAQRGARAIAAPIIAARGDEARQWLRDQGRDVALHAGALDSDTVHALVLALTGADG